MEERTTSSTGGQKGVKLARYDLIPVESLRYLAEHFGKGARKYAEHQWRDGYEWSKSYSAIQRHLSEFWAGRDYDVCSNEPEGCSFVTADGEPFEPLFPDTCYNHTGSHHLDAVMWHSFVLREFVERFPQHDDRYIPHQPDLTEVVVADGRHIRTIAQYYDLKKEDLT
jgi:hypothetical protein